MNTVYSGTTLNMNTGGTGLNETDYRNNPAKAGNLIGYRDVQSQRLSSAWQKTVGAGDLTITPYWRSNRLEYIATWTLNTGRPVPRGGVMLLVQEPVGRVILLVVALMIAPAVKSPACVAR